MTSVSRTSIFTALALACLSALAACGPEKVAVVLPPPPPPPPPVRIVIPQRPTPPNYASTNLYVPPVDAAGVRQSPNRGISQVQMLWNLRSAYNVGALNCGSPAHADILINYRTFLRTNARALRAANIKVDGEWRKKYGSSFITYREAFMTQVYNHFAYPQTLPAFCNAVLAMSRDATTIKPADLEAFAVVGLPSVEIVFDDFYRRYDAYRVAATDWDAKYSALLATAVPESSLTPSP